MAASDLDRQLIEALEATLAAGRGDARELRLHLTGLLLEVGRAAEALSHCRLLLFEAPDDLEALELTERTCQALGEDELARRYRRVLRALQGDRGPGRPPGRPAEVVYLRLVSAKPERP